MSRLAGLFQKRRGIKSGLPDLCVIFRCKLNLKVVFIELKSRRGTASRVQRQIRLELLQVGATWWIARSARACMLALYKEGVTFKRKWTPPKTLRPVGRTVRRPPASTAAAGGAGRAAGGEATVAGASARPQCDSASHFSLMWLRRHGRKGPRPHASIWRVGR